MLNQRSKSLHRRLHLERMEDRRLLSISPGLDAEDLASLSPRVSRDWFETLTPAIMGDISEDTSAADGQISDSNPAFVTREIEWQGKTVDVAADQWIVQLTAEATKNARSVGGAADIFENTLFDTQVVRGLGIEGMLLLETQTDVAATTIENWLADNPAVAYFEPNMVVSACATIPNDPSFDQLWGMNNTGQNGGTVDADIDAPEAWDITTGSSDIVVAVIDSGVDYTHPDLAANIWTNPGEIPGNGIDDDGNGFRDDVHGYDFVNDSIGDYDPMDDHYHGTHVAGAIAAVGNNGIGVTGVSWSSKIMALKILDSNNNGTWANVVRAINYATMMRNDYGVDIRLTNNSYGGVGFSDQDEYTSTYNAVAASGNAGILFVAAAGNRNSNKDLYPFYPASFPLDNIISVAATDRNDDLADFSNYGEDSVDLAAPGVDVYSTMPTVQTPAMAYDGFSTNYDYNEGTSMAAPHVSGVVALVWSKYPFATAAEIRDAVLAGVDPIASLSGMVATGGRLNALGALDPLNINMQVTGCNPQYQSLVTTTPNDFTIDFSAAYNPSTVAASDLLVNGLAANTVTLTDSDTAVFHFTASPVTTVGVQSMDISAGSILRAGDGNPIDSWHGTFYYDTVPWAVDDSAEVMVNGVVGIDVLANDLDEVPGAGWPLSFQRLTQTTHGTAVWNVDLQKVIYTPDFNYLGPDTFTYAIGSSNGYRDSATVTIDVIGDSPHVKKVEIGNSVGMVEMNTGTDTTQLIPVDVDSVDWIAITFDMPIDDGSFGYGSLDIVRNALAVYGRASGGWGPAKNVNFSQDRTTVTWTFNGGPYKGGEMILQLADIITTGGFALDGEWTSPENFEDNSGNSTFADGQTSGNETPGGDFVFSFTLPQTRPGDADCDGIVEEDDDAAIVAANWLQAGAAIGWTEGDFNGDEYVNDVDATIMATNMDTTVWPDVTPTQSAPLAYDLNFYMDVDGSLTGQLLGHTQGRPGGVTYVLYGDPPTDGDVTDFSSDGLFTYEPDEEFSGTDEFMFRVYDGVEYSAEATVKVYVGVSAPVVTCVTLKNSVTEQEQAVDTAADGFDQLLPVALYDGIVDSTSYALAG